MFKGDLFLEAIGPVASAALVTVQLTLAAGVVSLVAGALAASAQVGGGPIGAFISRAYVSLMRGTPLYVQLLVVYFGLAFAGLSGQAFLAAALAIGINSGAYSAEILRGAIAAIPPGQIEAAQAIGMSRWRIWQRVMLPQAFIASLPPLTAELTIVLKSTPLASVVAVTEMTYTGVLIQSRNFSAIEVFAVVAIGYIVLAQVLLRGSRSLERRFRLLRA
ncbi:amino acid ABC transporter permease [Bosea sp. 117]|uniref:amino acid ABC transporter permease n=1 Tax=Bosea sp. 117 TaxID=1125973 RepID=UPI0004947ECD|nr:amino acid ABC transporter permease [Bosea sp. 117]